MTARFAPMALKNIYLYRSFALSVGTTGYFVSISGYADWISLVPRFAVAYAWRILARFRSYIETKMARCFRSSEVHAFTVHRPTNFQFLLGVCKPFGLIDGF